MENILKKRLEIIKLRAKRLKQSTSSRLKFGAYGTYLDRSENYVPNRLRKDIMTSLKGEKVLPIEKAVPGEEISTPWGKCYFIGSDARAFDERAPKEASELMENLEARERALEKVFRRAWVKEALAGGLGFFDIETAGLSPSTYVFLAGIMRLNEGKLFSRQILARDYSEEKALLYHLQNELARFRVLVTYNGISFDMPFIRTRMAINRIDLDENFRTLDLLAPARRKYASILPNCKLETLRLYLTGVERKGDVPGCLVPEVYHDFVRSGDASVLKGVIYHNRMDMLAMVTLLNALCRAYA